MFKPARSIIVLHFMQVFFVLASDAHVLDPGIKKSNSNAQNKKTSLLSKFIKFRNIFLVLLPNSNRQRYAIL